MPDAEVDDGLNLLEQDGNIFQEPEGFYEPEKQPTFVSYQTLNGQVISLRLIGHSPLWGHLLWNGARTLSTYLQTHSSTLIQKKTILELGAGAGLPSLICALNGAEKVVVTDYPDHDLIENLRYNIEKNIPSTLLPRNIVAEGLLWGASTTHLTSHLPTTNTTTTIASNQNQAENGFDILLLADLLFNHSEHPQLLSTVRATLKKHPNSQALVFFTPYRPWLLQKDLAFFDLARETGLIVEKLLEEEMEDVMFVDDPGDEGLRKKVFGYRVRWDV